MSRDLSSVPRKWAQRGFTCAISEDPPGQIWPDFAHRVDELLMPIEGTLELTYLGLTVRPRPGEEFLIPARARYTVRNVGGTTARWYYGYRQGG